MSQKVVAIVQARMGSTRLPGKVLLDIGGVPMINRVMARLVRAKRLEQIVVATTIRPRDDALVAHCLAHNWLVYRGDEDDVLDRYYQTAVSHQADIIVRITSDCPLIDPTVVDSLVSQFLDQHPRVDYMCNFEPKRTYPRGLDAEIMTFKALERAWREDQNQAWREHVTPYIYRNPQLFSLKGYLNHRDYSDKRWTVDTPEDLAFVRKVYEAFGHDHFSWLDLIQKLEKQPEWEQINRAIAQKKIA